MNFRRVDPNGHYRSIRLLSDGGRWELGLSHYQHGMRLRMGLAGRPPQVMDFCLGRDGVLFSKVLVAMLGRLDSVDEMAAPDEVDALFPWVRTRPDMAVHLAELLGERHGHLVHAKGRDVPLLQTSMPVPADRG